MAKQLTGSVTDVCADCSANDPNWVSLNRGVMICDDCCHIHRSLGRHISQVKSIKKSVWRSSQLQMIVDLHRSGANSIWEHTLLDPLIGKTGLKRKPQPKDPLHPNKSEFIRLKYQNLSFINRSTNKEDSETDISEQLHSSVRTPNLKTSLRLLASGADLNYVHNEKYNCPLHMAAKAGQISQIELLLVYGANPLVIDVKGKTPIDYAKEANFTDIVDRLVESQYELSDRLTYFISGRIPDHKNGQHFLIPETPDQTSDQINDCKLKLQSLSNKLFEELSRDVYDEVDRREVDAIFSAIQTPTTDRQVVPFLPVNPNFSSTRNQGRQKLARLDKKEFTLFIIDLLAEIRRRVHGITQTEVIQNISRNSSTRGSQRKVLPKPKQDSDSSSDYDSEPLYDSVPSEDEEDVMNKESNSKSASNGANRRPPIHKQTNMRSQKSVVTLDEYKLLKEQLSRSDSLIEELVVGNQNMRYEITKLQIMVQKLIDENAQLRAVVIPRSQTPLRDSSPIEDSPPEVLPRTSPKPTSTRPQSMFNERPPAPPVPAKASYSLNNLQQNSSCFTSSPPKENVCQSHYQPIGDPIISSIKESLNTSHSNLFPTKEEVLRKTEQITRRIQELLATAQEGRHENFVSCSEKISCAVANMISVFPQSLSDRPNSATNERIYSALSQLNNSALKLRIECRSSFNAQPMTGHLQQDFRQMYQKVIESAFEIAKSAKTLVTLFQ